MRLNIIGWGMIHPMPFQLNGILFSPKTTSEHWLIVLSEKRFIVNYWFNSLLKSLSILSVFPPKPARYVKCFYKFKNQSYRRDDARDKNSYLYYYNLIIFIQLFKVFRRHSFTITASLKCCKVWDILYPTRVFPQEAWGDTQTLHQSCTRIFSLKSLKEK